MFWTIIFTAVIGYIFYYLFIRENCFDRCGVPTPKRYGYVLNIFKSFVGTKSPIDMIDDFYKFREDAKYVGYYEGTWPMIMLRDLEIIKSVTVKNFDSFVDHRAFVDPEIDPLFGNNLFSLQGDKWREVRSTLSPAFTSSKMKAMFKLMLDCGENFANYLVKNSKTQPLEISSKEMFTRYTNDAIATCAFGIAVDSMNDPDNDFYRLGMKATKFSGWSMIKMMIVRICPPVARFFKMKMIPTDVDKFFSQVIRDTITTRDEKGIVRPDMLQLMMDARGNKIGSKNPELDIASITSQAFIFFFAGFDSTATLMCFLAHEIAENKDVKEKLQREIDQVFEKCNGTPTYEAVNNMEYLDAVINETLRKYAIAIMIDRLCTKEFELPPAVPGAKPFVVKPGYNVWVPVWSVHRDPEYFPEPEKFRPERFMSPEKESLNTTAYMPFGVGPRMCIGNRFALMETKVLFMYLFGRCDVNISKKMILPLKIDAQSFNLNAVGGFWLDVEARKNKN